MDFFPFSLFTIVFHPNYTLRIPIVRIVGLIFFVCKHGRTLFALHSHSLSIYLYIIVLRRNAVFAIVVYLPAITKGSWILLWLDLVENAH